LRESVPAGVLGDLDLPGITLELFFLNITICKNCKQKNKEESLMASDIVENISRISSFTCCDQRGSYIILYYKYNVNPSHLHIKISDSYKPFTTARDIDHQMHSLTINIEPF
jgi:hypothetical protein